MESIISLAKSLLLQSDMTARLAGVTRIRRDTNKQEFTWDHLGITVIYDFRYQVGLGVIPGERFFYHGNEWNGTEHANDCSFKGTNGTEQNRMEQMIKKVETRPALISG